MKPEWSQGQNISSFAVAPQWAADGPQGALRKDDLDQTAESVQHKLPDEVWLLHPSDVSLSKAALSWIESHLDSALLLLLC